MAFGMNSDVCTVWEVKGKGKVRPTSVHEGPERE
jgi:hypothetical protein